MASLDEGGGRGSSRVGQKLLCPNWPLIRSKSFLVRRPNLTELSHIMISAYSSPYRFRLKFSTNTVQSIFLNYFIAFLKESTEAGNTCVSMLIDPLVPTN